MSRVLQDSVFARRRARLIDRLSAQGVESLLVAGRANVRYLSGFAGSAGALLVAPDGATLASDARYREHAALSSADCTFIETRNPLAVLVAHALRDAAAVGIEDEHIAWSRARELESAHGPDAVIPLTGLVEGLRAAKDAGEITAIEQACAITDSAVATLLPTLRPGETEIEVARRFLDLIAEHGAEGPAFPPIIAFGAHASIPHHAPTSTELAAGDLVLMDVGARVDGYHADMSRTVSLGEPSPEWRRLHQAVVEAQSAARAAAVPGVLASTVDQVARGALNAHGLAGEFLHGIGHGVGLEIHEAPIMTSAATGTLETFATITVEPGVYRPGVGGIRIEDTILVTPEGARSLTSLPRELLVL